MSHCIELLNTRKRKEQQESTLNGQGHQPLEKEYTMR